MKDKPKNPAAQAMARLSNAVKSAKRAAAAVENGKKGGRPKKTVSPKS